MEQIYDDPWLANARDSGKLALKERIWKK